MKQKIGTSVPSGLTNGKLIVKPEIKQIKREPAKDGTMRGGKREGAGMIAIVGGDH